MGEETLADGGSGIDAAGRSVEANQAICLAQRANVGVCLRLCGGGPRHVGGGAALRIAARSQYSGANGRVFRHRGRSAFLRAKT